MRQLTWALVLLAITTGANALTGRVTDTDGNPIRGALVEVADSKVNARTDASGRFSLDTKGVEVHEVHIKASGFTHQTLHPEDAGASLEVSLKPTVIEQIDVTATPFHASIMESAQPVTVVAGEELRRKQASTLGETLKNEVGVHSSYFGPVASTPIIRGLDGPRVLVTQNSLDVSDASRVGPDHVVATEASTARQIEILRGPATLFYGSGAIGGVVNIVDDRVPSSSETRGAYAIEHSTVSDENAFSAAYTSGTDQFAFHLDGFWREGNNYEIPGEAELETEEEHAEEGHEEHQEGVLENTFSESKGMNLGGSLLLDNGYIGLSYGHLKRRNGIPGHSHGGHEEEHEEEHGEEEEEVRSDLQQNRWQLISELSVDQPWLRGVHTRLGYTDYEHAEIENGEQGTVFRNETVQARVDLLLQEVSGWHGALSLEAKSTDFEAVGEEAFTPPSQTDLFAIALMQEKHVGNFLWQLGARIEHVTLEADPIEFESHHEEEAGAGAGAGAAEEEHHELLHFDDLDFTPYSLSAGVVWDFASDYNASLSLTHAQRAPSAAELFSYGAHIGTGSFEVGALFELHQDGEHPHFDYHDDVEEETSNNIDISVRKHSGNVGWVVNAFYNQIDNFYYLRDTGLTSEDLEEHEEGVAHAGEEHGHGDELPLLVFEQADAILYGLEAQLAWQFAAPFRLTVWGDSTRGKLEGGGNLPRIPPVRLGSQLRYQTGHWGAEIGVAHYYKQESQAQRETETDDYTLVDAEVAYTFFRDRHDLTLYLKGSNLTDEEARVHSSFLKDRAPLPGRGISFGIRGAF